MIRYIDADKAVEEARLSYCKDCNSYNGVRCSACGFDDAMTYIEDEPAADVVEVKHGEWKKIVKDIGKGRTITHYQCSLCDVYISEKANYCYHCGAKMDGGEQNDR